MKTAKKTNNTRTRTRAKTPVKKTQVKTIQALASSARKRVTP